MIYGLIYDCVYTAEQWGIDVFLVTWAKSDGLFTSEEVNFGPNLTLNETHISKWPLDLNGESER